MGTTLLASVQLRFFAQALPELHPCLKNVSSIDMSEFCFITIIFEMAFNSPADATAISNSRGRFDTRQMGRCQDQTTRAIRRISSFRENTRFAV